MLLKSVCSNNCQVIHKSKRITIIMRGLPFRCFTLTVQDQDSLYDYCSADDSCLDVICPDDENLPVRWKAPECLWKHRYSTASDVWAFGVLMYEVLTYGSHPYRNIPIDEEVIHHVSVVVIIFKEALCCLHS